MELRNHKTNNEIFDATTADVIIELDKIKTEKPAKLKSENIHKNHRSRLKSQFLENGLHTLTDVQKLELLLFYAIPQKDTNPLAHALIKEFGSIKNVLKADYEQLIKVKGVKENTATLLTLVNNTLRYCNMPDANETLGSTEASKIYASKCFFNIDVEQFYVFCLSKSNKIIKRVLIGSGTFDEVNVQIRHISKIALDAKCNRIIVAHNHPGGKAQASDEDIAFTYSLLCSCVLNSIDLIDHIIVGTDRAMSFGEQNLIQKLKSRALDKIQIPKDKLSLLSSSSQNYIISNKEY